MKFPLYVHSHRDGYDNLIEEIFDASHEYVDMKEIVRRANAFDELLASHKELSTWWDFILERLTKNTTNEQFHELFELARKSDRLRMKYEVKP